jgi:hypothetical protein
MLRFIQAMVLRAFKRDRSIGAHPPPQPSSPGTWSGGLASGDATVEVPTSTREAGALHPVSGSHPPARVAGTCSTLRGRGGVVR